jgi:hypothetical protein
LRPSNPDGAAWIGKIFDRIATDENAVCGYAVKLAIEAETYFATRGRDVLSEYAATQHKT